MYRQQSSRYKHRSKIRIGIVVIIVLVAVVSIASLLWPSSTKAPQKSAQKSQSSNQKPAPKEVKPAKVDLQPTVDTWLASQSGDYGIVVYDPSNKAVIASHQPDKPYFTASIYKLYVAYLALMDTQTGAQNPESVVLAGQTLKQCLYKMIHSSDSPCGEKVLNTMGQASVTNRLKTEFNLANTSFPAFTTSAQDITTILGRLQTNQDLNTENTAFLLDAMKTQIYRTGLPKGMPEATIADKIGFDSPKIWHDTAIVTLPNGREYIVSILGGGGVGSADIANFGQTIYTKLYSVDPPQ